MDRELRYDAVNRAETLEELAGVIEWFADKNGVIWGREKPFNAKLMAGYCRDFAKVDMTFLTREFGIRQQALMILYHNRK